MIRRVVKFGLLASALIGGGLLALATTLRETIDGSGVSATETRDISEVNEVVLSGTGDLVIVPGSIPSLTVTADDNVLPAIESDNVNGKLTLKPRSRTNIRTRTKIVYTLTTPSLSAVTVSGAGNVRSTRLESDNLTVKLSGAGNIHLSNLTCKSLNLTVSGAGTAHLAGSAEKLTLKLSGAGEIEAAGLKSSSADVHISGAVNATVWATDDLHARVSGAGGIKYKGTPKVEQKVSGAGRIRPLD
jgi:hypothetical protein